MKENLSNMTEKELREYKVPYPQTEDELLKIIRELAERKHDYGTCVYAMSISATAAFNYIAHHLGVTGFQASCADLDILCRTRNYKNGYRIINYENLLYPQYLDDKHFPNWKMLIEENKEMLKKEAIELLKTKEHSSPNVVKHWKYLSTLDTGK